MGVGSEVRHGDVLWEPPASAWEQTRLGRLLTARGLGSYEEGWRWSVDDLEGFWLSVCDVFSVGWADRPSTVLADRSMPGAVWFPGGTLNYAEHALRRTGDAAALIGVSQTRDRVEVSFDELRGRVGAFAAWLRSQGIGPGDHVVGYLPNVPETVVAFLGCASIGAVWSSCAPEFGVRAVIDRVRQVAPKVLLAVDGYVYGRRTVDRRTEVGEIVAALDSLEVVVSLPYLGDGVSSDDVGGLAVSTWDEVVAAPREPTFVPVAFDHPLYVLFSSGTTGLPKAIVHGHGGITVEHFKALGLQTDITDADRMLWFTTTGWMMWNRMVSALLLGATVVTFDGDPAYPDAGVLWRHVDELGVTILGVGAPLVTRFAREGLTPARELGLASLRQLGCTGSPLPLEGYAWVHEQFGDRVQLISASGGTDVCSGFVGASPLTPVYAGEMSCRCLAVAVAAFDEHGREVIGERGELVVTEPMPSMPVGFVGDDDGARLREAYFSTYPGVWRHGDWLTVTERGTCVISGRSDATLNRGGVRMGSAELTNVVDRLDGITESLVVHLDGGVEDRLVLFVVLDDDTPLDDDLQSRIATVVRQQVSPRHVPDEVHAVSQLPRTISGKVMEVPVKRLLAGAAASEVANPGAMANPESLTEYAELAAGR